MSFCLVKMKLWGSAVFRHGAKCADLPEPKQKGACNVMKSLSMMTISEVSWLMQERRLSPSELVEETIRNIHRFQGDINAYITILEDAARANAARLTEKMPDALQEHPLYGIPYGLKDLYYTKGVLTTAASRMYRDFRPAYDATVVSRLEAAGAILVGKENLQELGCGATSTASYYGPVRNPYDKTRIAGGSSGGSAAAVATGMTFFSMGSDAGGSIRIPASLCGVVGFKPSQGLVSSYGTIDLSQTLGTGGPLTRSVLDAAIVMDAITGFDPMDVSPRRYTGKKTTFARQLQTEDRLDGIRLGVPENYFFDKTDPSIECLIRDAIGAMQELGATIVPVRFDFLADLPDASLKLALSEAAWAYRKEISDNPAQFSPMVRGRLENGAKITAVSYLTAANRRLKIIEAWERMMSEVDAVVCPTLPLTAFPIDGNMQVKLRGQDEDGLSMLTYHTRMSNLTYSPALSLPVGLAADGLPAGMMIMGAAGDDLTVLKIGHVYEKHFPFTYSHF